MVVVPVSGGIELPPREVYPNAPLRLVAAEFRYPFAPRLAAPEALDDLAQTYRPKFPIPEQPAVQVVIGVGGPTAPSPGQPVANRFLSRDRLTSVTVTPQNTVVETTDYGEFDTFRPLIETALNGLEKHADNIVGLERVGLRYINEIRLGANAERSWSGYVNPSLLAPAKVVPNRGVQLMQGILQFAPVNQSSLVLRFGSMRGFIVSPSGPLRVAEVPADAPFFLLDIDSSWVSGNEMDEYGVERALELCDLLHGPVDEVFEESITERLRTEVLRQPK